MTDSTSKPLRVCALLGSLRQGSYNRMLLNAATEVAPDSLDIQFFDRLREIPLYDGDLEAEGTPESVLALREAIKAADLLLIVSPEYNRDIPGGLKNALDWVSRDKSVLSGKPTAIMGASTGGFGTTRMQAALRLSCVQTGNLVMTQPEIAVPFVDKKVEDGRLTDADTLKFLTGFMKAAADWATLHQGQQG
ncbi:NADPH-dependent FMN reductase (plasmid) [Deinococcus proteolyticus MRP]|uniref:NADPH-dependent FMN reductase n=1 Tax=Deinococcus proteolyticus (strain ATCC 35074 / DSM 20540 / JCM 6276 / NBRC 101906 / NCIMB 13154 / VKM Ac-1939 / CCM 2703 / MRP) TaxID=693977 RepID=F0RQU3_DEIPM|nr:MULTISPECIES: NADPH-dependent FMN reductase [Deinococcus]ADY27652.1 NADPH-dependent FMN reductase [Deinococcus proteolyticus MRP]MCY1703530.1 NAD(P)H-dependent oxidoreductase [Deinococcus sp. SL84]